MTSIPDSFGRRLREAGYGSAAWERFAGMYREYREGLPRAADWALIAQPLPSDLRALKALEAEGYASEGNARLGRAAWIVLNGGLGTSMRMDRAKSLLKVKGTKSFLDLLAEHVLALRRESGTPLPLLFMNSFATRKDTLESLAPYPLAVPDGRGGTIPPDFEQHRFPRIRAEDGEPFGDPADAESWAPPGHGDLFASLHASGALDALLSAGFRFAFVSNADNLGASPDPAILGYMAEEGLEFLVEVTPRTPADVKGGALVRRDGRLELLEIAQVPGDRLEDFQDIAKFPAFNTNNLWMDLAAVRQRMEAGGIRLPAIANRKMAAGTPVVQLETAMGAAVAAFERSGGVLVPRARFAPVKTLEDLLVRRSDVYVPGRRAPLQVSDLRDPALGPPLVRLDGRWYGSPEDLDLRAPDPPGLVEALSLTVVGDVRFGRGVTVAGHAVVENRGDAPLTVPDGAALGERR